jgi:hypothetical protein
MTNRTAWTPGNLNPSAWTSNNGWFSAFNAADLNSLPLNDCVLSSVTPFANGTALDQFMDVSVQLTIASTAVAAGDDLPIWIAMVQQDGTTIGDGTFTAGTASANQPIWFPVASMPLFASTRTTLVASQSGILLPPGAFALIIANFGPATLASSGNACSIRTYNQNLNN